MKFVVGCAGPETSSEDAPGPRYSGLLPAVLALAAIPDVHVFLHSTRDAHSDRAIGNVNRIPVNRLSHLQRHSQQCIAGVSIFCYQLPNMSLPDTLFRQWRKRLGLSQRQAAFQLGYCKRRIEAYDRGEENPPRVVTIAMRAIEFYPEVLEDAA